LALPGPVADKLMVAVAWYCGSSTPISVTAPRYGSSLVVNRYFALRGWMQSFKAPMSRSQSWQLGKYKTAAQMSAADRNCWSNPPHQQLGLLGYVLLRSLRVLTFWSCTLIARRWLYDMHVVAKSDNNFFSGSMT